MSDTPIDIAIVTGGGSGIGAALACTLAERGIDTLIIGRRSEPLQATAAQHPERIHALALDVSHADAPDQLVGHIRSSGLRPRYLVHNAATLDPVEPLGRISDITMKQHMAVNFHAPLQIGQALLDEMPQGARQLFISSGAAFSPVPGWAAYCCSKSALNMLMRQFASELPHHRLASASLRPGVVDTPMQTHIRQLDSERFPSVERFRQLHEDDELNSPDEVANFAAWLLLEMPSDTFHGQTWDIGDHDHVRQWKRHA